MIERGFSGQSWLTFRQALSLGGNVRKGDRAITGQKAKQPYAIAMKDGQPFALAAIWERWRNPETGQTI